MPNWIGDAVMATPVLTDLRKAFPESRITAMCRSPVCDLFKEDPDLDELFCFTKPSRLVRVGQKKGIIEKLRQGKYDCGILLTHSFSSAWWFFRGRVQTRVGYDLHFRRLFLTHPLAYPKNVKEHHLVGTYKGLLEPLGIPLSETAPRVFLLEKEIQQARLLLEQYQVPPGAKIVGINPGASYGSAKCWLPDRFRAVAKKLLIDPQVYVVFLGDTQTASLIKEITGGLDQRVVNLAGLTSLRELASLIKVCDVLLTNDSGPMHLADALGTRVVALFGSTSPLYTGPYSGGVVLHKQVSCSPCYRRTCPIDFRCMKQISVEEVYQAIRDQLANV